MKTLRVGICGCLSRFHGKFERHHFVVNGEEVVLTERTVSERNHRASIRSMRVHFFLDSHLYTFPPRNERRYFTDLYRVDFRKNPRGRQEHIRVGGIDAHAKRWEARRRPTATVILKKLQELLDEMKPKQRDAWLARVGD